MHGLMAGRVWPCFFGEVGVWMGYALADPIVGALITIAIAQIVWQSAKAVFTRALDGVDPKIIDELRHAATHVRGVEKVTDVRARWLGHRLYAEMNVAVAPQLPARKATPLAKKCGTKRCITSVTSRMLLSTSIRYRRPAKNFIAFTRTPTTACRCIRTSPLGSSWILREINFQRLAQLKGKLSTSADFSCRIFRCD